MTPVDSIRNAIARHALIPDGAKVVAGISGGADSVALLHAFRALDVSVTVAHLNHRLRGAESDADEVFVRALADELEYPFVTKSVDVQTLAASSGQSIEMAARQARHEFFAELNADAIALAHHADDQVETFLLRLARGAGPEGLAGMPSCQTLGPLRLIRPMLAVSRTDLVAWLETNGWTWREDASNVDEAYLRNRVRHTVLPLLERELNPNIRETILRTMDILRQENEWMDAGLEGDRLNTAASLPLAAQRRLLRKWLFEQGARKADFEVVERILSLMAQGEGSVIVELNGWQRVVVEYGRPRFEEAGEASANPAWLLHIEPGTGWKKDHGRGIGILPVEASFDATRVGDSPIEVRTFRPGDRMEPLGMEGSRKLQDIFTDQKLPRAQRSKVPVVVCRDEIIWLPGYRIARNWAVRGQQEQSVTVRIEHRPMP